MGEYEKQQTLSILLIMMFDKTNCLRPPDVEFPVFLVTGKDLKQTVHLNLVGQLHDKATPIPEANNET